MAELPGITRETLDVDVVIVGAGPAGLAAAYRLAELIKAHNDSSAEKKLEGISIAVLTAVGTMAMMHRKAAPT